ncbi:MAG: YicC family protein [Deltaproteobacteria bacterium]|nr:YicC family protein [Deltaproteobacteria bacterium]
MAKSMTGYGRAEVQLGSETYSIEVKSLNNRFLDVNLRVAERFSAFDAKVRDEIKKRFSRGSFTINAGMSSASTPSLRLNLATAKLYLDAAETLRRELGVTGMVDVNALLKLKDIFTYEKPGADAEADWGQVKTGLAAAFDQLDEWRAKEGATLTQDLLARLEQLERRMGRVEARVPEVTAAYRNRVRDEMEKLLNGKADETRILLEAALFAQRSDIAEELARLKSHLTLFRGYAASSEPAGKRLDFLCQEMGREVNTIGSKSADADITADVVEMKAEMEKIREQVQNIE